ncbi:4Fe-4S binding protein [Trinickia symbiotica]|uniref:4Fe-4S binding domain-containing protein n=1 Tax=Trinickia symbiotica TaxID=863227 RepID=A0A2N7WVE1_9BURK|nr:4Fe-4S binding protein [Trinickia symbiotica]PMS33302.1 4Fe-4S binding domain-containing protein [Trinickia symbiotica]PPK42329.1 4Fe-4S binding protein [Trinickia symbiotica]
MSARIGVSASAGRLAHVGDWMQRNAAAIRAVQWLVVAVYAFLIVVPACLPLPDDTAHLWSNLTLAAQFVFWGIWWPFVLLSMVLLGRVWCGVLCPEGALAEFASRHGRGRAIPRWMRWGGWPFVAFGLTTIYGQMVSVYQYPLAVLLVLGGSTFAAIVIGLLYGREKRVWCRYLCPVNGVFSLLARLAPFHYKVDEDAWRRSYKQGEQGHRVIPINCAPLVPLRNMKGAASCHMCGRCSGHREAIALSWRSPSHEVVELGRQAGNAWDTALVLYGLLGVAIGAFHWTVSPWFVQLKQFLAMWLIDHDVTWPLATNAPWFVLTHYPDRNDVFSWLDGTLVVGYILATAVVYGTALLALIALAARALGSWDRQRLHHLTQALIPVAGAGVFLGLSATTVSLLRAEHLALDWVPVVRIAVLAVANSWSAWLGWRIACSYRPRWLALFGAMVPFVAALAVADSAWWLMFWGFSH